MIIAPNTYKNKTRNLKINGRNHKSFLFILGVTTATDPTEPSKANYYHPKPQKDFEFTMDHPRLTLRQRQFYEENGFLVIPKLVPEDLLDHCRERFLDLVDGRVPKGNYRVIF